MLRNAAVLLAHKIKFSTHAQTVDIKKPKLTYNVTQIIERARSRKDLVDKVDADESREHDEAMKHEKIVKISQMAKPDADARRKADGLDIDEMDVVKKGKNTEW